MFRDKSDTFWVTDRLKEMEKYTGQQIAPSELEDLLVQHEKVVDAAVCVFRRHKVTNAHHAMNRCL
jgi:acyl-coenzyme A synthetase/AMP-(fatty) acid ligase